MTDSDAHMRACLDLAYRMGRDAGETAGSWACDGNTDPAAIRRVLRMLDNGDPFADYYLPQYPDLSGQWADSPTPDSLAREIMADVLLEDYPCPVCGGAGCYIGSGIGAGYVACDCTDDAPSPDVVDAIARAWEEGVSDTFRDACERELRAFLPEPEPDTDAREVS